VCLIGLTGVEPLSESCSVSPAGTGLTGGAHRSDRCGSVDSRFGVPLRSRVRRVCVLVPRSSGTLESLIRKGDQTGLNSVLILWAK
jgi:hypothetical protein